MSVCLPHAEGPHKAGAGALTTSAPSRGENGPKKGLKPAEMR
ncbi:MAG: hypothetical protein ROR55_18800 [Devosia sp.]